MTQKSKKMYNSITKKPARAMGKSGCMGCNPRLLLIFPIIKGTQDGCNPPIAKNRGFIPKMTKKSGVMHAP